MNAGSLDRYDVVVIGAGFGGLGAALSLAERGARVAVCEALRYPGGCASTFRRAGYAFEAGATLFSGLGDQQLFGRWIERHRLPVVVDWLDPIVELRAPGLSLAVSAKRDALVNDLAAQAGADAEKVRAFFALQKRVADVLWELFDDPELLPPWTARSLLRHARRSPRYLGLLPLIGRPLLDVLERCGVAHVRALRTYLDAVCQITVQASAAEAEAPFALGAMDYFFRGTGHVRGGIGVLASALVDAIRGLGGDVLFSSAVRGVRPTASGFVVSTRRGELRARKVVGNVLPHAARTLLGKQSGDLPALDALAREVETGWGAAMIYATARAARGASPSAHHLELVLDPTAPFHSGNHVFVSISGEADVGRAPPGYRTITASTHLPMTARGDALDTVASTRAESAQAKMRDTLAALAPDWWAGVEHLETASPRTFERFTGRFAGYVGGIPRRAGLACYRHLGPRSVLPGFYLVGDSVFPGQSTLGAALGGVRLAARIATELDARSSPELTERTPIIPVHQELDRR